MKVAVLGVGAIGGVVGAYLARAGHNPTLIDVWPANVDRIKEKGLIVSAVEEEFTVEATALHLGEVSASRRLFDVVMLCVKSYDTEWSTKFIQPYLAPGGFVVSAQNSINDETIAGVVGWTREVGCVVTLGAGMYEPGRVERSTAASRQSFTLGEPSGLVTARVDRLSEVLSAVGPVKKTTNLWGERWAKLGVNCMANAVAGVTGLSSADIRRNDESRNLSIRITAELVEVAAALGVSVEPISKIPATTYREALQDNVVMKEVEDTLVEAAGELREGRPSLAQDVMKGRKTEVEHLNGYVVRKGEEAGVPAPINAAVLALTKRVESGELAPSVSNLKLLEY